MMDLIIFAAYRLRFVALLYVHFIEQPVFRVIDIVKRSVWKS
jgi:hypothetical protein